MAAEDPDEVAGAAVRIAVVGDYQPDHETHPATTAAIGHAAQALGAGAEVSWLPTDSISGTAAELLAFDGVWVAPASPYRSLEGALRAITVAREQRLPLLGTCAGFQHLVLEFARNVMGLAEVAHAEYEPDAETLFVTPLSCSLSGKTFDVDLVPDSRAAAAYGATTATERYYCNFGLNTAVVADLTVAGLLVTGTDTEREPRVVELPGHPFFLGTLFVPQVASSPGHPHPLVLAFVQQALRCATDRHGRSADGNSIAGAPGVPEVHR